MKRIKGLIKQFFKFGIVGVINTVSSWVFYYSLLFFNIHYIICTTIAYVLSSIIGFILNKTWVFKSKKDTKESLFKYIITYGSSYFLNIGLMYLFVDIIGISDKIAPLLVLFFTIPYNFIFSKLWVFKNKDIPKRFKDHTFTICAYKESKYLEECIISLKNQTVKSNIIICTSTPNKYIYKLAKKYKLKYYIKDGKSDIQDDWNFAISMCNTDLVTVAHQDDIYHEKYLENILSKYTGKELMLFTEQFYYKNDKVVKGRNSFIKKFLKLPLRIQFLANIRFIRKLTLSFGNTINCPSVTYNVKLLGKPVFTSDLKYSLDWDTFLKIYSMKGRIAYISKPSIYYRIHDEATSKTWINDNKRYDEDVIMFRKRWPKFMVKIIMKFYIKCYDVYK